MTKEERQRIVDLYESRLAQFGRDVRTVGWNSQRDQFLRFAVLCRDLDLDGKRILDVGCGLGDLVTFLEARQCRDYDYVGVDLSAKLVEEARARFDGPRRTFLMADILDEPDIGTFDFVFSSGALSFRISENMPMAQAMLAKMFALSREAVAVNFLSSYVDYQLDKNFHYSPEVMFSFARTVTKWIRLHHDYPLYEFTLQLFRKADDKGGNRS